MFVYIVGIIEMSVGIRKVICTLAHVDYFLKNYIGIYQCKKLISEVRVTIRVAEEN